MYTVKRKSDVGAAGEDETSNGGKRVKSSEPVDREDKENEVKKEGAGEGEAEKKPERLKPYKECTFFSLPPPSTPPRRPGVSEDRSTLCMMWAVPLTQAHRFSECQN